jgi:hypothetical protein
MYERKNMAASPWLTNVRVNPIEHALLKNVLRDA